MKKKLILQINSVANSGSTGRIAEDIGRMMLGYGWESYIAYGRYCQPSDSTLYKIGSSLDVALHGVKSRLLDKHGLGSARSTTAFIKYIQSVSPDIIHLHNIHGYYLNYPLLFSFLSTLNTPVVWTFHDCWPLTGHCAHFLYSGCEKWKTGCFNCSELKTYPTTIGLDNSRKNYQLKKSCFNNLKNLTIVPVSAWLENIISHSFFKDVPQKLIYNGIDTTIFCPQKETLNIKNKYNIHNEFVILGVANMWTSMKGLEEFYKLRQLLPAEFKIVLVGLNEKQISSLPEGIQGIKRTENLEELATLYSLADVYINLTWEDNFPTTALEAMGCGTPVITYDTGGCKEALDDETGFVVKQGDLGNVVKAVYNIKEQTSASFQNSCRKRAVHRYNKQNQYIEYYKLYEEVLTNKAGC